MPKTMLLVLYELCRLQIEKKSSAKVTSTHIREVFTKHISKSGIIAYYISKKQNIESKYDQDKPSYDKRIKTWFDDNKNEEWGKSGYVIEYFDLWRFDEFWNNKSSYDDGILQKFEDPKGDYNITYRLSWSPKLCIFEKCINIKKLTDRRYDWYERVVTYDGEQFQTKTEPWKGNNLPDRFEKIAMSMASHISNITLEKIKIMRMTLNFKIGKSDQIIFWWCSSLRVDNSLSMKTEESRTIKECDMTKISVRTPDNINLFKYSISGRPIQPHKNAKCWQCDLNIEAIRWYEISFKMWIEAHDNRKRDKELYDVYEKINMTSTGVEIIPYKESKSGDVVGKLRKNNYKNFIIPKVISVIFPKMTYEDYFSWKADSIFLAKTASVCDSCFLDLTRYCTMGGTNMENLLRTMKQGDISLPVMKNDKREKPGDRSRWGTTGNNINNRVKSGLRLYTDTNVKKGNMIDKQSNLKSATKKNRGLWYKTPKSFRENYPSTNNDNEVNLSNKKTHVNNCRYVSNVNKDLIFREKINYTNYLDMKNKNFTINNWTKWGKKDNNEIPKIRRRSFTWDHLEDYQDFTDTELASNLKAISNLKA